MSGGRDDGSSQSRPRLSLPATGATFPSMASTIGRLFRVTTWGESHGGAVGAVVDGCPPRLPLSEEDIQPQLDRRRPGQSRLTTPRQESDRVRILSGVFEGRTLGSPILLYVANEDARPGAYEKLREVYRPSHADFTYEAKYGLRDWQGGGRASARETVGRVAAGAIAGKLLRLGAGLEVVAYVRRIASIEAGIASLEPHGSARSQAAPAAGEARAEAPGASSAEPLALTREAVDHSPVRCPDDEASGRMVEAIEAARREGDSLGGVIECFVRGVPRGLGEPVFDKLEADLARAMLSIPACTGFEVGSGFSGTERRGSENNDEFAAVPETEERSASAGVHAAAGPPGGVGPPPNAGILTNRSGGIQGGISNGEAIWFRVAFKPTATIRRPQQTIDRQGGEQVLEAQGRHDPCVLPRAVPIVEAMAELILADHWLRQIALEGAAARVAQRTGPGEAGGLP